MTKADIPTTADAAVRKALAGIDERVVAREQLRARVLDELQAAGFEFDQSGLLRLPDAGEDPKLLARRLHRMQRQNVLLKNAAFIEQWEDRVLDQFANGGDVVPEAIRPTVVPVTTEAQAAVFRFASLHWSVPVSQGYGRRTRFLVYDESNGKLIGIFALGDPVFNLAVRDNLIGWTQQDRRERLYNVYDAYVLGAVEPYRQLIAGKLMAMCAAANETADYLISKYAGTTTVIKQQEKRPEPVLLTTTSALGRSSIYNRLKLRDRQMFHSVGFTEGFGHFHFTDDLFDSIVEFITDDGAELRGHQYGDGPNWRIRTIRRGLNELGLDGELLRHGLRREVFLAPRAIGWRAYLRGESEHLRWYDYPMADIAAFWRERWAVPRASRDESFSAHDREAMRLSTLLAPLIATR